MSRAPAEKVTGEVTVAPLAGEQILTVLSTVAVHCADAKLADAKRNVAARKARSKFTKGPRFKAKLRIAEINFHHWGPTRFSLTADTAPPAQAQIVHKVGEHRLPEGCP